jgi:steroid 5-alpha reductase family enzyme
MLLIIPQARGISVLGFILSHPYSLLPYCPEYPHTLGELLFWWSIFIGCSSSFTGTLTVGYYTIVSPIFVTALLFGLSGLPLLESGSNK